MRILLLAPASSIHTIRWASAFSQRGHFVYIVSLPNHSVGKDRLPEGVILKYLSIPGGKGYYLNAEELRDYAKNIKADIINAHFASGYGTLARRARVHPLVVNVWGSDIYEFPRQGLIQKIILRKNINNADEVASTSYCMADETRRVARNSSMKITITPFGVDTNRFKPLPEKKQGKDIFIFGTVKSLTHVYGIDIIIKAFREFYDIFSDNRKETMKIPKLLIFGEGEEKETYIDLINKYNLNDNVEINGYIPNSKLPELINTFDVSCFASLQESFGVSVVESMSCGIPVIASNAEGFREVIKDGETGLIVPRNDPSAMAEKMWDLYCNEEQRIRMGEEGRKRVLALYKWENNVDALENLLASVTQ